MMSYSIKFCVTSFKDDPDWSIYSLYAKVQTKQNQYLNVLKMKEKNID